MTTDLRDRCDPCPRWRVVTLGLRPQRGRLRGAGRPARGRRLPARRRRRRRRHGAWSTPAASSRPPRRTPSTPCSRPPTSRSRAAPQAVVAVGCLAERYGKDLAESLPEADAVLGFDDYPDIAARLRAILAGERTTPHTPQDRRRLLPISPGRARGRRPTPAGARRTPHGPAPRAAGSTTARWRRSSWPRGCDRRCSFCAIPQLPRLVRQPPSLRRAGRGPLAGRRRASRELFLVSENSTSYGKDLGDLRLLETLLPELAAVDGVERVRVSYLQPAETRPGLVEAIATHARRGAVLRPVLPARQRRGAAPDAPLRRPRELPRPARADPRAGARGRRALQRHRRLPRRDRGRPRRRSATSWPRPGWTSPACSATPTRTAPRPRRTTASSTRTRSAPAPSTSTALVEELTAQRAEERIGEERRRCWSSRSTDGTRRGPRGPPGPRGRRHHDPDATPRASRVGDLVPAGSSAPTASTWSPDRSEHRDEPSPEHRSSNLNLPNVLTTLRIVMVPFFGWALLARRRRLDPVALRRLRASSWSR